MCLGLGQVGLLKLFFSFPTRIFGSQNLNTVKLKGVGESFKKYPDYESKGIKAHFNLDESGVLSLDRVRAKENPYQGRDGKPWPSQPSQRGFHRMDKHKAFWEQI